MNDDLARSDQYETFVSILGSRPIGRAILEGESQGFSEWIFLDEAEEVLRKMGLGSADTHLLRNFASDFAPNGNAATSLHLAIYEACDAIIDRHTHQFQSLNA